MGDRVYFPRRGSLLCSEIRHEVSLPLVWVTPGEHRIARTNTSTQGSTTSHCFPSIVIPTSRPSLPLPRLSFDSHHLLFTFNVKTVRHQLISVKMIPLTKDGLLFVQWTRSVTSVFAHLATLSSGERT